MFRRLGRYLTPVDLLLGVAYLSAAAATVSLTRFDGGVAFIWISSAFLLARLVALPPRQWIGPLITCAVATVITSTFFGFGFRAALPMLVVNLGESLLAASLLRRAVPDRSYFESVSGVSWFIGIAGILAPFVSGIGAAAITVLATGTPYVPNLLHWFAAHGLGIVITMPALSFGLEAIGARGKPTRWMRRWESATLLSVAAIVAALVFGQDRMPLLFVPFLPMMLATMRGGRLGASMPLVTLAVVGGAFTVAGHGPIILLRASSGARTLFFQAYIASGALLVLPVAGLLKQRAVLIAKLTANEARFRVMAERAGDAILDVAADGVIRYVSPAITDLTGRLPAELIGTNARMLVVEEDLPKIWAVHEAAIADPSRSHPGEYRGVTRYVEERWFEVVMRAIVTDDGESLGVIGSVRDVSERKRAELQLVHQVRTDPLTGLANRRAFNSALEREVARIEAEGGEASVAIFDLDHFKSVNDTHGHDIGDAVLREVAAAVGGRARESDLVARIGGEEFAVLFARASTEDALIAVRRLMDAIRRVEVVLADSGMLSVTASFGLAAIRRGTTPQEAMRSADHALYSAKRAGRNCLKLAA